MNTKRYCWIGLCLYAVLSVVDYNFTFALIDGTHGDVAEANPIAAAWLELHGWVGLAVYKAGGVLLFVASTGLLVPRRPRLAAAVIALGCVVLTGVTAYSHQLMASEFPPSEVYFADEEPPPATIAPLDPAAATVPSPADPGPDPATATPLRPVFRSGGDANCVVSVNNCGANGEQH